MELTAEKRQESGKKVRHLRKENKIPAVMFGKGLESVSLSLNYLDFDRLYKEAGETNLIDLNYNSESHKVLIKEVQYDPISDKIIHVGFYKPDLTEKVEVNVPVEVIGEEENDLIKSGEAVVLVLLQEITISALPTELKDAFVIDVSKLTEVGAAVTVAQLDYDREKVEIVDVEKDEAVVRLDYAQMAEEEEEVSEEELIEGIEATEETEKDEEEAEDTAES
ncbi:50S ribosomal protein L25 [Patescibacteria group bacterium]|nr:50S ribosomal protein L25 [Patescibacteria group bacterium]